MIVVHFHPDALVALGAVVARVTAEEASSRLVNADQYESWQRAQALIVEASTGALEDLVAASS